jgi:hypothetical protein
MARKSVVAVSRSVTDDATPLIVMVCAATPADQSEAPMMMSDPAAVPVICRDVPVGSVCP